MPAGRTHAQARDQRSAAEGEPCLWVIQTENRPLGASPCPNRVLVCPCQACEDTKWAAHLISQGDALGGGSKQSEQLTSNLEGRSLEIRKEIRRVIKAENNVCVVLCVCVWLPE